MSSKFLGKPFNCKGGTLPTLQVAILRLVSMRRQIRRDDVVADYGCSKKRATSCLRYMHMAGRIRRVEKGLYEAAR